MSPTELDKLADVLLEIKDLISGHVRIIAFLFDVGLVQAARDFSKVLVRLQEAHESLQKEVARLREAGIE